MSIAQAYVQELQMTLKFFSTTISVFDEADSGYAAQPEMFTVAGQVAHPVQLWMVGGTGSIARCITVVSSGSWQGK